MSYIDYRVIATAKNDEVAGRYIQWLRSQLIQLRPQQQHEPKPRLIRRLTQPLIQWLRSQFIQDTGSPGRRPGPDTPKVEWGGHLFGRFGSLPPVVERLEPAPGTNTPRILTRLVFTTDAEFEFYNEVVAPWIRQGLSEQLVIWSKAAAPIPAPPAPPAAAKNTPLPAGDGGVAPNPEAESAREESETEIVFVEKSAAEAAKAKMKTATLPVTPDRKSAIHAIPEPPPAATPGGAPSIVISAAPALPAQPAADVITLARNKSVMTRLPFFGVIAPIAFGLIVAIAIHLAAAAMKPTFDRVWPKADATSKSTHANPHDPAPASGPGQTPPVADGKTPSSPDAKPATSPDVKPQAPVLGMLPPPPVMSDAEKAAAAFVNSQAQATSWVASFVALFSVLVVVVTVSLTQIRRGLDQLMLPKPVWSKLEGIAERGPRWWQIWRWRPQTQVTVLLGLIIAIAWRSALKVADIAPERPPMLQDWLADDNSVDKVGMGTILSLTVWFGTFAALALGLAFASLLLRQRRRDTQSIQTTVHIRLKAARFLLNAGSAALVCAVLQIALLVRLALPSGSGTAAEEFPWNYAVAWGAMFTVMLVGFYVPTVSTLTAWGHRFVLLNSEDDSHEERIKKLAVYDDGFRAEFKPYMSLAAALAPAAAAVFAKLIDMIPSG